MLKKLNKCYVSPIDQKLADFDSKHPTSPSQEAEIQKHQRIAMLRDQEVLSAEEKTSELWESF